MKSVLKMAIYKAALQGEKLLEATPSLKKQLKKIASPFLNANPKSEARYAEWVQRNFPDAIAMAKIKRQAEALEYRPLLSIVVPTYNTDHQFLRDCFESVLAQAYDNWELCVVDDASPDAAVREIIQEYAHLDTRIRYKFLKKNQHISGATNEAIALTTGEFVSLFDHDDLLWPNALYEIAKALNADRTIDFLYTDEDKITDDRTAHQSPFFKPDWSPDFLHSVNYITHFSTIRKSLLEEVGGLKAEYNGAQDWDLFLRISGKTDKIHHIPTIVYSWRIHHLSTAKAVGIKPYVIEAQQKAIQDDLHRKGQPDATVMQDPRNAGYWVVNYPLKDVPLISIIIPTKNQYKRIKRCVEAIYSKSAYQNFEVIIVDASSTDEQVLQWYRKAQSQYENFRVVKSLELPVSAARSCNEGARHAKGEILFFIDSGVIGMTPEWLERLGGDAQRAEVGAVGCLQYTADAVHVQRAGLGVGFGGTVADLFSSVLNRSLAPNQHIYLNTKHNITALSSDCLMIRKTLFEELQGFDEALWHYSATDLCLRLIEKGCNNIYTPHVQLICSDTLPVDEGAEGIARATAVFKKRWNRYIAHDPNINPNISREMTTYEIDSRRRYTP